MNGKMVFIGAGNMAEALVRGLLRAEIRRPADVTLTDINAGRLEMLARACGVRTGSDNMAAVREAAIVVLAVKPQVIPGVLREIHDAVTARHLVISVAAGVTLQKLATGLGDELRLVRAMPNMPALAGAGMTVFCRGVHASAADATLAESLFASVGQVLEMDERHLDAVTALSGSGPAYAFYLAEAMTRAGVELGLPPAAAARLAAATMHGAGCMLVEPSADPAELRCRVTSPGGTTEAAVKVMDQGGFTGLVADAMRAACRRAAELQG